MEFINLKGQYQCYLKCNDKCVTIKAIGGTESWRKQQH